MKMLGFFQLLIKPSNYAAFLIYFCKFCSKDNLSLNTCSYIQSSLMLVGSKDGFRVKSEEASSKFLNNFCVA